MTTFLEGFTSGFLPTFQNSGQAFLADRRSREEATVRNRLLESQLSDAEQARAFALEDRERQQAQTLADLGREAEGISATANLLDTLSASGGVSPLQAQALEALPVEQRGTALLELTGLLEAGPSAAEQAELAKIQAQTRLAEAQASKASRPDDSRTALEKNLAAAGINPASEEGQKIIRDTLTGAAQGQNAASVAAEKERAVAGVRRGSARQEDLVEVADAARSSLDTLRRMQAISGDIATGPAAELRTDATKIAEFLGVGGVLDLAEGVTGVDLKVDNVPASEEFSGLRAELDLQARALQKGPQTDADAAVIAKTTPQASDDAETIQRKIAQRVATTTVIANRAELEDRLISEGVAPIEARKQALDAIPSPGASPAASSDTAPTRLKFNPATGGFD